MSNFDHISDMVNKHHNLRPYPRGGGGGERERDLSHISVPLIIQHRNLTPYKFVANSSQITWTRLI